MTWAYQADFQKDMFAQYGRNQDVLYHAIISTVQSTVLGYSGTYEVIALGAANNVTGLARGLTSVSASLSLVVCGISIAEKVRMKKEAAAAEAEKVVQ